jgi:hypothetical protein
MINGNFLSKELLQHFTFKDQNLKSFTFDQSNSIVLVLIMHCSALESQIKSYRAILSLKYTNESSFFIFHIILNFILLYKFFKSLDMILILQLMKVHFLKLIHNLVIYML